MGKDRNFSVYPLNYCSITSILQNKRNGECNDEQKQDTDREGNGTVQKTLVEEEKSESTIEKYLFDLESFKKYANGKPIDKVLAVAYKETMVRFYRPRSVNVKISALKGLFKRMEWHEYILKQVKIQKESFRASSRVLSREEYGQLLATEKKAG